MIKFVVNQLPYYGDWILLIITVPVAIFDKFFRPYCMTVIERMCNKDES